MFTNRVVLWLNNDDTIR